MKRIQSEAKKFGLRLKELRTQAQLSAEAVARAIPVAPSTYREWENGRAITGLPYKNLAAVLGISVVHLLDEQSGRSPEIHTTLDQIDNSIKKLRTLL